MVSFLLINLTGPPQVDRLDTRCDELDGSGLLVIVKIVTMRELSADKALDRIEQDPSLRCLLPWIPLMDGGDQEVIIKRWLALAAQEPDTHLRSDYAALALVFSELTRRKPLWKKALEGWNMQESPQVLEWQREALEKGLEQGIQARRDYVKATLENRFQQALSENILNAIGCAEDAQTLDTYFKSAWNASSLEEFEKTLVGH